MNMKLPLFGTIVLLLSLVAPSAVATDVVHVCLRQTADACGGDACATVGESTSCLIIDWQPCTVEHGDVCVDPSGECPVRKGEPAGQDCVELPDLSGLDCWARVGFTEVARVCVRPDAACPVAFETAEGDRCAAA